MGLDLIINTLAHRVGTRLDWMAGLRATEAASEDELGELMDACGLETEQAARAHLKECLGNLQAALEAPWRGVRQRTFGSWRLYVIGGSSFGDDPNPAYTAADAIVRVESVRQAIRFQWPRAPSRMPGDEHPVLDALLAAQGALMDAAGQYSDDGDENPAFQDPDGLVRARLDEARREVDGAIEAFHHLNPAPTTT